MANIIGIDVKKLRDLENGKKLPDSEIISKMYEAFKILPVVIIGTGKLYVGYNFVYIR